MKIHDENCTRCTKTVGEKECFESVEEMMQYHKEQRRWFVAKWEDYIYYPLYRLVVYGLWDKIRPGKIKHYYQRAVRGHSYMDSWDITHWMLTGLIPMLRNLRYNRQGTPLNFYLKKDGVDKDQNPTKNASIEAEKRFNAVLDEILYGLKCAQRYYGIDFKDKREAKKLKKGAERSFHLMGKHFADFWD